MSGKIGGPAFRRKCGQSSRQQCLRRYIQVLQEDRFARGAQAFRDAQRWGQRPARDAIACPCFCAPDQCSKAYAHIDVSLTKLLLSEISVDPGGSRITSPNRTEWLARYRPEYSRACLFGTFGLLAFFGPVLGARGRGCGVTLNRGL